MFKNTGPATISEGIIAVAALFAVVATGVAFVIYDLSLFASASTGGVVGVLSAIVLALGWRDPAPGPNKSEAPVAKAAPKPASAAGAQAPADDGRPEFLSAAREGGPDDLKQIKGVGPKLEKTLHDMGIFHFDQIAGWGPKEQAWMDDNLEGFKGRVTRDNWLGQAKTLAAGGETEFSKKVDKGDVY
ncbi:NADH:ubiquinone oxidoreductase [Yoonia sp.]|uniref:NADH:ubiquinone oxidoreductase n=1 Tax=Yoonia sp. TaxID=2212373 RepID=UPI003974CB03